LQRAFQAVSSGIEHDSLLRPGSVLVAETIDQVQIAKATDKSPAPARAKHIAEIMQWVAPKPISSLFIAFTANGPLSAKLYARA
jgi:hypothetical protein